MRVSPRDWERLRRLICLCADCHRATHFGLAGLRGHADAALRVEAAFAVWSRRSAKTWALDLTMLTDAGVTLTPPPDAADRVDIARARLD
ncbi:hypothetical protein [Actinokineospora iranica]|uniref:HNH endonuclease n=1 Tax=Actinokineospora iranica TaxID=1271860 RepID=A0A1G6MB08_9PSEU|nr:hypothetical protein [Actinokineospora iranica]SDC52621.1 hypothetical protein SAMN05216174_102456 [Actinokineospora iranica]